MKESTKTKILKIRAANYKSKKAVKLQVLLIWEQAKLVCSIVTHLLISQKETKKHKITIQIALLQFQAILLFSKMHLTQKLNVKRRESQTS